MQEDQGDLSVNIALKGGGHYILHQDRKTVLFLVYI